MCNNADTLAAALNRLSDVTGVVVDGAGVDAWREGWTGADADAVECAVSKLFDASTLAALDVVGVVTHAVAHVVGVGPAVFAGIAVREMAGVTARRVMVADYEHHGDIAHAIEDAEAMGLRVVGSGSHRDVDGDEQAWIVVSTTAAIARALNERGGI